MAKATTKKTAAKPKAAAKTAKNPTMPVEVVLADELAKRIQGLKAQVRESSDEGERNTALQMKNELQVMLKQIVISTDAATVLASCPHCGMPASVDDKIVTCGGCGANSGKKSSALDAVLFWNQRA